MIEWVMHELGAVREGVQSTAVPPPSRVTGSLLPTERLRSVSWCFGTDLPRGLSAWLNGGKAVSWAG
jgi:hypothetical protein